MILLVAAAALAAAAATPIDTFSIPPKLPSFVACPKAKAPDDIVVCGGGEAKSPYRLPLPLPPVVGSRETISPSAERNGLLDHDAGGIGTCSAVGPGGAGCAFKKHQRWVDQRAGAPDPRGWLFDGADK